MTSTLTETYWFQKSIFLRDGIGEKYHEQVERYNKDYFEPLMLAFDKSITPVENEMVEYNFVELIHEAINILDEKYERINNHSSDEKSIHFNAELNLLTGNYKSVSGTLKEHIEQIANMEIHIANMVGTGYGSALLPPALARALAAAIPGATYRDIPDSGHCPMLEQPDALVALLREFAG